ncbi:MAG: 4-hydroxy-tetrahydrodipicolinate synthase [Armatimonadota bacterium]|nr:4-hydroxy-tetrahydrodipicolinate synthase [Armatimonadota bacterium]MDR7448824.1 4-hydroxy-tetrahydrodipicolinate synthase [Armatimonadota bacterium]MDR7459945.1 4-hydroxy-tetrahydrodipicolinate synthase [Armatimonadota bacterium]MDR7479606.1 4-hydroxy-tetrahydrodipicolinate synthase [Armatimonadota bacterium]MDR7488573.1 4-hydroxy-tetrahydrodipicolinate synthase [Armatimonadota bacterium]
MLRGSLVPLVTPFRDGQIDHAAFDDLIEWQIASGTHGLVIGGTTGEPTSLSLEEREFLIERAVRRVRGRVPVIAGTGTNNLDETLRLTAFARRAGADAVLVVVPSYVRPSQEGLYRYFSAVAAAADLPVILYNIPGRTAMNLDVETMARLADAHRNIVGVKEANKDFEHITRVFHRLGSRLAVYSGIELFCFPLLALGGAGHVSATGNVLPREVARLYDLAAAGRWEEARELHTYLVPMNEALFLETNPVPAKTALGLMGRIRPEVRPPLAPLGPASEARLRAVLEQYGLLAAAPVSGG